MPYLQLDTPFACSTEQKRRLAERLGAIYAEQMQTDTKRVTVAIRVLGEDGIWRCGDGAPRPAGLLMCDIRRGRSADQRAELAKRLIGACREILSLDDVELEFTQHAGDEMYHPSMGGWSADWHPDEGKR